MWWAHLAGPHAAGGRSCPPACSAKPCSLALTPAWRLLQAFLRAMSFALVAASDFLTVCNAVTCHDFSKDGWEFIFFEKRGEGYQKTHFKRKAIANDGGGMAELENNHFATPRNSWFWPTNQTSVGNRKLTSATFSPW